MPNYCDYEMKVKGKKENLKEWIELMENYDKENHFWRIFEANIYDEADDYIYISGYCAWSIESCCRASGYSGGVDLLALNTERLNLEVEIWSQEPGMCFQEHYIYNNGKCILDECIDWNEWYYDEDDYESFDDFKKEMNLPDEVIEDDLEDGCYYHTGGFEKYGEFEI